MTRCFNQIEFAGYKCIKMMFNDKLYEFPVHTSYDFKLVCIQNGIRYSSSIYHRDIDLYIRKDGVTIKYNGVDEAFFQRYFPGLKVYAIRQHNKIKEVLSRRYILLSNWLMNTVGPWRDISTHILSLL